MQRQERLRALLLAAIALLFSQTLGCTPRPAAGEKCKYLGRYTCIHASLALYCNAGTYVPVPCRGPDGCGTPHENSHESSTCDDRVALENDPCPAQVHDGDTFACAPDGATALVCRGGKFVRWRACRGPKGCSTAARELACDITISEPGDPCSTAGAFACSVDAKRMLQCDGQTLKTKTTCGGHDGCRLEAGGHRVECDDSIATEGDVCDTDGALACSADKSSELVCVEMRYARKRGCKRAGGCAVKGGQVLCAL